MNPGDCTSALGELQILDVSRVLAGPFATMMLADLGATVTKVEARGKHLLVRLSTGDVLHTHLGMTGSWHVYPAGERWLRSASQARLVVEAGDRVALAVAGAHPAVLTCGDGPGAAIELMEALAAVRGTPLTDTTALARRLLELPLPPGPALMVSSRPDARTAEDLSRILDRPVAYLNAARPPSFYQPPT